MKATRRMSASAITIPRLATERLQRRKYRQADFDDFAAFLDTPRSGFNGGPMLRELAWRGLATHPGHWALRGFGFWAVEEKATGAFCGHVGLWHPKGWPEPELGLGSDGPGRGPGPRAGGRGRAPPCQSRPELADGDRHDRPRGNTSAVQTGGAAGVQA